MSSSTRNEYQPTKIRDLLQQATGQTWYYTTFNPTSCSVGGCLMVEILSRYPIQTVNTKTYSATAYGRAQVTIGGVPINFMGCHLDYYSTSLRTQELNDMMAWAHNFAGPRLVGGDFNSWWGEWWIGQMTSEYSDTWVDYSGNKDGAYTTNGVRFDYIFRSFDGGWRLKPTYAYVAGTSLSDHSPFIADFKTQ